MHSLFLFKDLQAFSNADEMISRAWARQENLTKGVLRCQRLTENAPINEENFRDFVRFPRIEDRVKNHISRYSPNGLFIEISDLMDIDNRKLDEYIIHFLTDVCKSSSVISLELTMHFLEKVGFFIRNVKYNFRHLNANQEVGFGDMICIIVSNLISIGFCNLSIGILSFIMNISYPSNNIMRSYIPLGTILCSEIPLLQCSANKVIAEVDLVQMKNVIRIGVLRLLNIGYYTTLTEGEGSIQLGLL